MSFGQTSRAPSTSATRRTQWVQPGAAAQTGSTELSVRNERGNEQGVPCEVSCGLENWFIGPVLGSQMVIFMLMAFLFAEGGRKVIWKFKNWRMSCDANALFFIFPSVAQVFLFGIFCFLCVQAWDGHFSHTVCINEPKTWKNLLRSAWLDLSVPRQDCGFSEALGANIIFSCICCRRALNTWAVNSVLTNEPERQSRFQPIQIPLLIKAVI